MTTSPDIQYRALLQAVEDYDEEKISGLKMWGPQEWITKRAGAYVEQWESDAAEIAATLPQGVSPQAVQVTDNLEIDDLVRWVKAVTEHETFRHLDGGPLLWPRRVLKELIAAQPQAQPPQESVADVCSQCGGTKLYHTECGRICHDCGANLSEIEPEPAAQPPAQSRACEPVAWVVLNSRGAKVGVTSDDPSKQDPSIWDWIPVSHSFAPLYTHPPAQSDEAPQRALVEADAFAKELVAVVEEYRNSPNRHIADHLLRRARERTAALDGASDGAKPAGGGEGK
jgi:hypothetical protein